MSPVATVRPDEADLLAVARALFAKDGARAADAALFAGPAVEKLGPTAMRLLQDTLAKGAVRMLARLGGARLRRRAGPRGISGAPRRVLHVSPPPSLAFGRYSFLLLRWLTDRAQTPFLELPRSLGDELFAYLALRLVHGHHLEGRLASQPGLAASALAWLGFARSFAGHAAPDREEIAPPSFQSLLATADGRLVVACLEGDLRERWTRAASWPRKLMAPAAALRMARAEGATVLAFLDALERCGAPGAFELATFFVEAGARLLPRGRDPSEAAREAAPRMVQEGALRVRSEARRASGATFLALARLGQKREEFGLLRFFDEGYDEAQATLASWDVLGKAGFARAAEVVGALSSLEGTP